MPTPISSVHIIGEEIGQGTVLSGNFGANGDVAVSKAAGLIFQKINGTWTQAAASGSLPSMNGTFNDPNGHYTPPDQNHITFYSPLGPNPSLWKWDTTDRVWYAIIEA